jgi:predicted Na+-dependent transporter
LADSQKPFKHKSRINLTIETNTLKTKDSKFMSKLSPILFIITGVLFFVTAFTTSTLKAVYIALGTVFLLLGATAYRRQSKTK